MPRKKNILLLIERIYRANGGASTSLDLSETIHNLGYNGQIAIAAGSATKLKIGSYFGFIREYGTRIPVKNIHSIPRSYPIRNRIKSTECSTPAAVSFSNLKTMCSDLIEDRENRFNKLLKEADLIIDACMMPRDTFTKIRNRTSAPIIYNHNGSPDAVENYWIKEYHLSPSEVNAPNKYNLFCSRYDGILFQAYDQAGECAKRGAMTKENCFVVPPSCQEKEVLSADLSESPYPDGRRAVVVVGSVQPRKAQDLAIEAFSKISAGFPDTDLHIVGGGSLLKSGYGEALLELVKNLNLEERVFFHGHREDYLRFMAHSSVILQSSKAEGVSRILREAMLMRKPIASFNIPGTSSTVESGKEALLVKPEDTDALGGAIGKLLKDEQLTANISEAAFSRYLLNHSWPCYASNIKRMIEHFFANRSG